MTKEQKIIKGKIGLLELAKQLGNVSQACKMLGYIAQRPMWSGETSMASSSAMNPRSISTAITHEDCCPTGSGANSGSGAYSWQISPAMELTQHVEH